MADVIAGVLAGVFAVATAQGENISLDVMEAKVLAAINLERKKQNRKPLAFNKQLAVAARKHSQRMVREKFFDHEDPTGRGPSERVDAEGYRWSRIGENIAMNSGYRDPVPQAVVGWMKSPGHRRNILDSDYTETGIGIARVGKSLYFTQVFARPRR